MKKINNRGFVATAVLYSLAVLTATVLFINVKNLATTRKVEKDSAVDAKDSMLYYTIVYNGNGSTGGTMKPSRMSASKLQALTKNAFSRTGYTYTGWTISPTGAKRYEDQQQVNLIDENLTGVNTNYNLYATWSANSYTVTFDANGGTAPSFASKSVTFDSKYGALPTSTRNLYIFDGWYTARTGGTKVTDATILKTASNHTLYAHWKEGYYVLFDGSRGINRFSGSWSSWKGYGKNTGSFSVTSSAITCSGKYKNGNGGSMEANSPSFPTQGFTYFYMISTGRRYSTSASLGGGGDFLGGTDHSSRRLYSTRMSGTSTYLHLSAYSDAAGHGTISIYKIVLSNQGGLSQATIEGYK